MKRRLLLSYLVLAAVILLALEVPLGMQSARRDRAQLAARARGDAQALAVLVAEDMEHPVGHDLGRLVGNYRYQSAGAEVAVVNGAGSYVVRLDPAEGDHDDADLRPGIRSALGGASVIRSFRDEGRPVLSATVPVGMDRPARGAVILSLPGDATDDQIETTWAELAVGAIVILAITTIVGLRMARSVTAPLARLEGAVGRLGRGNLSSRASPEGPLEIRALGEAFNQMAVRLEELVSEQGRFVADASHQLRSPLTALRLRLENLEAHGGDDKDSTDLVAAEDEVLRLSRLVDGLLTLNGAESQVHERQAVDVVDVVDERCAAWSPLAVENHVAMIYDREAHDDALPALLVPGDLEQILDNLFANALDATPAGGAISASVAAEGPGVVVHVVDDGPGMGEEERVHAFDRFWQGSERRRGRSGLGLAIVRQLVIRNGGTVALQGGESGGLDAVVAFPIAASSPGRSTLREPAGPRR